VFTPILVFYVFFQLDFPVVVRRADGRARPVMRPIRTATLCKRDSSHQPKTSKILSRGGGILSCVTGIHPAELKFLRFKLKKSIVQSLVRFYLLCTYDANQI